MQKIQLKQYKLEKIETDSKIFNIPNEDVYYFETGIRRSIKIEPVFSDWEEEPKVINFNVTMVYLSGECKIEKHIISIHEIEKIYEDRGHKHYIFLKSWILNHLDERKKEDFEEDLTEAVDTITELSKNGKRCSLKEDEYNWVIEVDGTTLFVHGKESADFLASHYGKLGYETIWL